MGHLGRRARALGAAVLVALAAACSGGGNDPERTSRGGVPQPAGGDAEPDLGTSAETVGFRFEGVLQVAAQEIPVAAVVASPDRYVFSIAEGAAVRDGDALYSLNTQTGQWLELDAAADTSTALLGRIAELGPSESSDDISILVITAVVESFVTEPVAFVDAVGGARAFGTDLSIDTQLGAPAPIADALELLELAPLTLRLVASLDPRLLGEAALEMTDGMIGAALVGQFSDWGAVGDDDVTVPDPDEIDPTPFVEEEALAEFDDTPLVAPATLPEGLVLTSVRVLVPGETLEGCTQVELIYTSPQGPPPELDVFIVPRACVEAFSPEPFDQTFGGFPSRADGYEVLVGDTVVQFAPVIGDVDTEALAAALAPTTTEALLATVVPIEG